MTDKKWNEPKGKSKTNLDIDYIYNTHGKTVGIDTKRYGFKTFKEMNEFLTSHPNIKPKSMGYNDKLKYFFTQHDSD